MADWRTYLPHREDRLALVVPSARGHHIPIRVTQVIGTKRWSLAVVRKGPITPDAQEETRG